MPLNDSIHSLIYIGTFLKIFMLLDGCPFPGPPKKLDFIQKHTTMIAITFRDSTVSFTAAMH
jgi:hypothetical protein